MFKHILVPLDGSSFGEAALAPAFALAQRTTRTRITLVSVQDLWSGTATALPYEEREHYLRGLVRARGGDDSVRCVVRCGHATDQIIAEAEECGADLIVMSTHGRGGVSRLWLGSVTDQCLRHATIPVLLVRPRPGEQSASSTPHRVIVPLDGTAGAETALRRAVHLAQGFALPIVLVRVVPPVLDGSPPNGAGSPAGEALAYLNGVAAQLRAQGLTVTREVHHAAHAAEGILAAAAGDPIVMSTHARAPVARALLGSVADKVVRGARGVVLLIPPRIAEELRILSVESKSQSASV